MISDSMYLILDFATCSSQEYATYSRVCQEWRSIMDPAWICVHNEDAIDKFRSRTAIGQHIKRDKRRGKLITANLASIPWQIHHRIGEVADTLVIMSSGPVLDLGNLYSFNNVRWLHIESEREHDNPSIYRYGRSHDRAINANWPGSPAIWLCAVRRVEHLSLFNCGRIVSRYIAGMKLRTFVAHNCTMSIDIVKGKKELEYMDIDVDVVHDIGAAYETLRSMPNLNMVRIKCATCVYPHIHVINYVDEPTGTARDGATPQVSNVDGVHTPRVRSTRGGDGGRLLVDINHDGTAAFPPPAAWLEYGR